MKNNYDWHTFLLPSDKVLQNKHTSHIFEYKRLIWKQPTKNDKKINCCCVVDYLIANCRSRRVPERKNGKWTCIILGVHIKWWCDCKVLFEAEVARLTTNDELSFFLLLVYLIFLHGDSMTRSNYNVSEYERRFSAPALTQTHMIHSLARCSHT